MKEKAYAKINLSIDVVRCRVDGYHDLDMIVLPIDLYDVVDIKLAKEDSFECNVDLAYDENNLIYKAIELIRKEFNCNKHFKIKLTKNIPMGSGLAGGSSDAAACLRILNNLLSLGLSYSQLACFGKQIGADIPFCIYQQAARVRGIGEIVEPFHLPIKYHCLLIKPEQSVETKVAYQMLNLSKADHPNIKKLQQALINGDNLTGLLGNSLLEPSSRLVEDISIIMNECKQAGYQDVMMTGSGSTVFVISKKNNFNKLYKLMKDKYDFVSKNTILTM